MGLFRCFLFYFIFIVSPRLDWVWA